MVRFNIFRSQMFGLVVHERLLRAPGHKQSLKGTRIAGSTGTSEGKKPLRAEPLPRRERYEQLLQSARSIVERGGVGALTMSALTQEAGVSRPVVYEHFKNSEAIAITLLEDYFEKIVELVSIRTRGAKTLDEYLTRAIEAEFEYHSGDNLFVRNLTNGHATGKRLNEAFLELRLRSVETFEDLLNQQGAKPEVARVGGYALAELIPNVAYEFAAQPITKSAMETLTAMVLGAIRAVMPNSSAKPEMPAKVVQASLDLKRSRKRRGAGHSAAGRKNDDC